MRLPPSAVQPRVVSEEPLGGGIGNDVGGALETGDLGVLGGSILLQAARPQIKITSRIIRGFSILDIFLQVVFVGSLIVMFVRQRLAGHAIFALDPAAEVHELAPFRTEWTKGIIFPLGWLPAGWTLHES